MVRPNENDHMPWIQLTEGHNSICTYFTLQLYYKLDYKITGLNPENVARGGGKSKLFRM